jgi:hypothetical protein
MCHLRNVCRSTSPCKEILKVKNQAELVITEMGFQLVGGTYTTMTCWVHIPQSPTWC